MSYLAKALAASNGKFVTVTFIKANGDTRQLNGRLGVVKHLKHGTSTVDHSRYINIYDVQSMGYRNVCRDSIVALNVEGVAITQHN